jgi:hypothetical protein
MSKSVLVILFLLPWQTRDIFDRILLNGDAWEYGVYSVYAVEVLILALFFRFGRLRIRAEHRGAVRALGVALL